MNRYTLLPEDELRVLPPEDGEGAAIRLFCERTMILFEISQIASVSLQDAGRAGRCLCFTAPDALLGGEHEVFVPVSRPDYAEFLADFKQYAPALDFSATAGFVPESCDHTGRHRV
jgi:hypothetical protein